MLKRISGVLTGVAVAAVPMVANAAGVLTVPAIDLTDFYAAAAVLLTALTAIWIATKVIGFFRTK